jgi:RNA polymerase sigma-70 factor (ECF subfamily)
MIFDLVVSYVKNSADAEDLTQEVFLKAYQNLSSLKEHGQFSFWLKRIAKNHCTDWLRRRRENHLSLERIKVAESVQMASSPEEMALKQELRGIIWQAIDSLLEIDRKLLKARYLDDASLRQLQADYGLSYPAIVNRLKRAKQKVRRQLKKLLEGFCALPGREILLPSLEGAGSGLEKLMLGGIEAMKLSLKTKLVTVGVAVILGLSGIGIWLWHSNEAPKPSIVQQEVRQKKATSAMAKKKVLIPKPTPKVATQAQPTKPPAQIEQTEKKREEISDEEWAQFAQWLAEMEQSDEQDEVDKLVKESEVEPEPEWITQEGVDPNPEQLKQRAWDFLEALVDKDFERAYAIAFDRCTWIEESDEYSNVVRVINIGEPFRRDEQYADGKGVHIPFEIEIANGTIRKAFINMRWDRGYVNMRSKELGIDIPEGEWVFDGGL